MYKSEENWRRTDEYFISQLVDEDDVLLEVKRNSIINDLPHHEVAANQGKFLSIIAQLINAKRILEFGTLAGYSTIWFARTVGNKGFVITLEVKKKYAEIARENFKRARVNDIVEVMEGPAIVLTPA